VVLLHPEINDQEVLGWGWVAEKFYFESRLKANHWEIQWNLSDDYTGGHPLAHKIYNFIKDFGMDVEIIKEND
jgi:hypothetical protein